MLRLRAERRHALYLSKMKGLCFNCLARDHKVATCRSPTKCWSCRCSRHISTRCPLRKDIKTISSTKSVYVNADHHARSTHQLTGNKQPDATSPELLLVVAVPHRAQVFELAEDPMRLEAELACRQQEADHGKLVQYRPIDWVEVKQTEVKQVQEEVKQVEAPERDCDQAAYGASEDCQTPMVLRSETEQLIGHQLIKDLSSFKHKVVDHVSSSNMNSSPMKEEVVVSKEGKRRCSRKVKNRIKFQKSGIKVVRDMLTRKWIFIKKHKQLGDLALDPYSVRNFEAIKKLTQVVLFMETMQKIATASEKDEKKENKNKHNFTNN